MKVFGDRRCRSACRWTTWRRQLFVPTSCCNSVQKVFSFSCCMLNATLVGPSMLLVWPGYVARTTREGLSGFFVFADRKSPKAPLRFR